MEIFVTRKQGSFTVDAQIKGAEKGVTALYGASGAGKTSIVNMVAGLMRPDAGRIVINGWQLFDSEKHINLPPEKRRIGYVFQDGRLLPHLSVRSNLVYGMKLTPVARRFVQFDSVVDLLGIGHLLDRRPALLSGGEKQRVAIGRALLTSPALLLMDEPLASLDAARKDEVLPFITRLGREFSIPVLYVSHSLDEILNLATHLVIMEAGRVVASGSLETLLARSDLQTRFGCQETGAVISTVVEDPEDAFGLTCLRFCNHLLKVLWFDSAKGESVRVRIPARHVAIALEPPKRTSFLNILPGSICDIVDGGASYVDVCVDIGCALWARITRQSYQELELKTGQAVYALVKSAAVSQGTAAESSCSV